MSYLIRTGTGRNNISYGGGKSTKAKYLRRTGTGRTNISWIDINSNGTYNVLERTGNSRNNIRWYNTQFSFVGHKEISYYLAGIKDLNDNESTELFIQTLKNTELTYFELLNKGLKAQESREVLPNATKTELNMKANLREWRHFFNLRCSQAAHPDIRILALDLLKQFHEAIPIIFDDLYDKYVK